LGLSLKKVKGLMAPFAQTSFDLFPPGGARPTGGIQQIGSTNGGQSTQSLVFICWEKYYNANLIQSQWHQKLSPGPITF
jgi:hypothetical protein